MANGISIERFIVTSNLTYIPLEASSRHKQCPNEKDAKKLYPQIIDRDLIALEIRSGGDYCWNNCALTDCPAYRLNRKDDKKS